MIVSDCHRTTPAEPHVRFLPFNSHLIWTSETLHVHGTKYSEKTAVSRKVEANYQLNLVDPGTGRVFQLPGTWR